MMGHIEIFLKMLRPDGHIQNISKMVTEEHV